MTLFISQIALLIRYYLAIVFAWTVSHLMLLLLTVWRYRKSIILENLRIVFPHHDKDEIYQLASHYYRHISNLFAEAFILPLAGKLNLTSFVSYTNLSLLADLYKDKKDVILLCSHYGNWEYLSTLPLFSNYEVFAPYSTIKQSWINSLIHRIRSAYGVKLITKNTYYKFALAQEANRPVLHVIIADQRPASPGKLQISFFDQLLTAQSGAERLSKKKDFVILYADVYPENRFAYTFHFKMIKSANDRNIEITQTYFSLLEETILRNPAYWLWSHRRWAKDKKGSCQR